MELISLGLASATGPVGALEGGAVLLLEDVAARPVGDVAHLVERVLEASAVVDPGPVELGFFWGEEPGHGPAVLFPGQLVVGAVTLVGVRAAAVRVAA